MLQIPLSDELSFGQLLTKKKNWNNSKQLYSFRKVFNKIYKNNFHVILPYLNGKTKKFQGLKRQN